MDAVILDDEIAPALAAAPIGFELSADVLPAMRAARGEMFGAVPLSDAVERTDHVVSDDPHVVVRVHRPRGVEGPLPCVFSIHGGGWDRDGRARGGHWGRASRAGAEPEPDSIGADQSSAWSSFAPRRSFRPRIQYDCGNTSHVASFLAGYNAEDR